MPRGPSLGLNKHFTPSPALAAVIGPEARSRPQVVSDLWKYIREHDLQDPADKRQILPDDKLRQVLGGRCSMFEINKLLNAHLN